jgi:hypothetical protein
MVQICFPNCYLAEIDDQGYFLLSHAVSDSVPDCIELDFSVDEPIHTIFLTPEDTFVRYSLASTPEQHQIGSDHLLDLGTHSFAALPDDSASYTATDGATVDQNGVQFELAPGDLLDAMNNPLEEAQIKILPLSEDNAVTPFIDNPYFVNDTQRVDLLYYVAPYLTVSASGGVVMSITPPSGQWSDGDTVTLYVLGEYIGGFDPVYISCHGQDVHVGELRECGSATVTGGKIVTDPITVFSWIGLKKN